MKNMTLANVIFKHGTKAAYAALATKDTNTLYWCTDTGELFRGSVDFSKRVEVLPAGIALPVSGLEGKLYVALQDDTTNPAKLHVYTGGAWVQIAKDASTAINVSSTHATVATSKAVFDHVAAIQLALEAYADSAAAEAATGIDFEGVVIAPTYEPTNRVITLPRHNQTDLVINLGKDMVVQQSGTHYDSVNKKLVLSIVGGGTVEIPVTDLIPIIEVEETDTVTLTKTVDSDTGAITFSADVKVSAGEDNILEVVDGGLLVESPIVWSSI
jgi:hypothetical protein